VALALVAGRTQTPCSPDRWHAPNPGTPSFSLDVMPGSSHESLSEAGWKVFLAAFVKAATHG
jgi:hypothetical protein